MDRFGPGFNISVDTYITEYSIIRTPLIYIEMMLDNKTEILYKSLDSNELRNIDQEYYSVVDEKGEIAIFSVLNLEKDA